MNGRVGTGGIGRSCSVVLALLLSLHARESRAESGTLADAAPAAACPSPPPLRLAGARTLLVDPACNAWTELEAPLSLTNTGAESVPLDLRAEPLLGDGGALATNAAVELARTTALVPTRLEKGASLPLAFRVQGNLAPGKWVSRLFNGNNELATMTVAVPNVPFNVRPEVKEPTPQPLTLTRGERSPFLLRNDDAIGYDIEWRFTAASGSASGRTRLPPAGVSVLALEPTSAWFSHGGLSPCVEPLGWLETKLRLPCFFDGILGVRTYGALLSVKLRSRTCPDNDDAPTRTFPLSVQLAYYDADRRSFWTNLVLFVLLFVGALTSLYVNYKFPDDRIRRELKEQFKYIGTSIATLSTRLDSALRVPAGVELRALKAKLRSLRWYHADFQVRRAGIVIQSARLQRRVELLRRRQQLHDRFSHARKGTFPPSSALRIDELFGQVDRTLGAIPTQDADLADVEQRLGDVQRALSGNPDFDGSLQEHIAAAFASFVRDVKEGALKDSKAYNALESQLGPIVKQLTGDLKLPLLPAQFYMLDAVAVRGKLLRDYALLCDRQPLAPESALLSRRQEFVSHLLTEGLESYLLARRLLREFKEGVFEHQVRQELEDGKVEIVIDRNQLNVFEPAIFSVRFQKQALETSAARFEWLYEWNFGHAPASKVQDEGPALATEPSLHNFTEECLSVSHYFPQPGTYRVWLGFRHEATGAVSGPDGSRYKIGRDFRVTENLDNRLNSLGDLLRANLNEAVRVGLALVPAVLALLAGAKEQLLKMDSFLALTAAFLAGFGSDQVKNLLSEKTDPITALVTRVEQPPSGGASGRPPNHDPV